MSRQLRRVFFFVSITVLLSCAWVGVHFYRYIHQPMPITGKPFVYEVKKGMTFRKVANALDEAGLLSKPIFFVVWAHISGNTKNLHVGEYAFEPGSTPLDALNKLASGKVLLYKMTFVEGWRLKDMREALKKDPNVTHTLDKATASSIAKQLKIHHKNPEGLFEPETYRFPRATTDVDILQRAHNAQTRKLKKAWQERSLNVTYQSPYQAVIAASLIEKETAIASEKPIIAGVMERRIKRGMPLQIDASIIYGLGKHYTGDLTRKDMRKDTPYNTYLHGGWPPTPICIPSMASIQAALHPEEGTALYFVAKGDGTHVFSDTLKQQQAMIQKYILKNQPKDEALHLKKEQKKNGKKDEKK